MNKVQLEEQLEEMERLSKFGNHHIAVARPAPKIPKPPAPNAVRKEAPAVPKPPAPHLPDPIIQQHSAVKPARATSKPNPTPQKLPGPDNAKPTSTRKARVPVKVAGLFAAHEHTPVHADPAQLPVEHMPPVRADPAQLHVEHIPPVRAAPAQLPIDHMRDAQLSVDAPTPKLAQPKQQQLPAALRQRACGQCQSWAANERAWAVERDRRIEQLSAKKPQLEAPDNDDGGLISPEYFCPGRIVNIGGQGDQRKLLCPQPEGLSSDDGSNCLAITIGKNTDFKFEARIHQKYPECDIHTFDASPRSGDDRMTEKRRREMHAKYRMTFHSKGISDKVGRYNKVDDLKPLTMIVGELQRKNIAIAKIDCAGCEWDAFFHDIFPAMKAGTLGISQLLIDVHAPKPHEIGLLRKFMLAADDVGLRLVSAFEYSQEQWTATGPWWRAGLTFIRVLRPDACDVCPAAEHADSQAGGQAQAGDGEGGDGAGEDGEHADAAAAEDAAAGEGADNVEAGDAGARAGENGEDGEAAAGEEAA